MADDPAAIPELAQPSYESFTGYDPAALITR